MQYSFELSLEGAKNKIRTANQFVPGLDALIPKSFQFLYLLEAEMLTLMQPVSHCCV